MKYDNISFFTEYFGLDLPSSKIPIKISGVSALSLEDGTINLILVIQYLLLVVMVVSPQSATAKLMLVLVMEMRPGIVGFPLMDSEFIQFHPVSWCGMFIN